MRIIPQGSMSNDETIGGDSPVLFFSRLEIVQLFRNKLEELEPDIEEILKMEYGEKMLENCQHQVSVAVVRTISHRFSFL